MTRRRTEVADSLLREIAKRKENIEAEMEAESEKDFSFERVKQLGAVLEQLEIGEQMLRLGDTESACSALFHSGWMRFDLSVSDRRSGGEIPKLKAYLERIRLFERARDLRQENGWGRKQLAAQLSKEGFGAHSTLIKKLNLKKLDANEFYW